MTKEIDNFIWAFPFRSCLPLYLFIFCYLREPQATKHKKDAATTTNAKAFFIRTDIPLRSRP